MSKYTIKKSEAKRIQNIDVEERIIHFDDIELDQEDEDGNNLGISFIVHQVFKAKMDIPDPDLPPSHIVQYHHLGISNLKMINGACDEIPLSEKEQKEICKYICDLIRCK